MCLLSCGMGAFAVTPADLAALQGLVGTAAGAARRSVGQVRAEADDVLRGWHGEAARGFGAAWAEWLRGAALVLDALDELATLVGGAGTSYATTDDGVRAAVARAAVARSPR